MVDLPATAERSEDPPLPSGRGTSPARAASPRAAALYTWHGRHALLGVTIGLGLGAIGQVAVWVWARREPDASWALGGAAVLYSALALAALALLLAAVTHGWLAHRAGRIAALFLSTSVLGATALVELFGITLRILTGTYLTTGAVMFSLNSSEHFLHAAAGDYRAWALGMVLALVVVGALVWRVLSPAARPQPGRLPPPRVLALGLGLACVATVVYLRRSDTRFTRRMFVSGPLLALVSSLDAGGDFELARTALQEDALGSAPAPLGPPLAEGEAWNRAAVGAKGPRPNVLLLMLESIAPSHLGHLGYARDTSPHIDRLAQAGLTMTHAWATSTHSNYSQMAILSSLFPRRGNGLDQYTRLDYPRVLFHDVFHKLGYATATISSQDENWQGMRRFQATATPTFFWFSDDHRGPHLDTGTEKIVPDGETVGVVLDWLDKQTPGPWALYVNFQATHFPYLIPDDAEHPYQPHEPDPSTFTYLRYPEDERDVVINRYDNALAYVDRQVGRLLGYLERQSALDDTLIVLTADHGEAFFDKGLVTHGKTLFDIEARVPIVLHWPSHLPADKRSEPVSHLDVMPTILELLQLPPHPAFQGRSFAKPDPGGVGHHAIVMNIQGLRFADGVVCWPYKLILDRTSKTQLLFDLESDPDENHDLLGAETEVAQKLADGLSLQLLAQLDYHAKGSPLLAERYQPRMRPCPGLR